MREIQSIWTGATSYAEGNSVQEHYQQRAIAENTAFFLGFEFQPVITLGKRSNENSDLLSSANRLRSQGFDVHKADRGGFATMHDEGQLVIYPVFPIRQWNLRLKDFIDTLQNSTVEFLDQFGIDSHQKHQVPGLYTDKGKIAFFGFRIVNGVSQHGLSINVSNELQDFDKIRSCGIQKDSFDRVCDYIGEEDRLPSLEELFFNWCRTAKQSFNEEVFDEPVDQDLPLKHLDELIDHDAPTLHAGLF